MHPLNPPRSIALIGAACGLGGADAGPAGAPATLRRLGLTAVARRLDLPAAWQPDILPSSASPAALPDLLQRLAGAVAGRLDAGELPVVIGGDHAIAAGTWRGVGRAIGEPPGLLWIDAHLDAHTPATSPSGHAHGMPLAALLGHGEPGMTSIDGPTLDPGRVAVFAARDWEAPERALLDTLGVAVFDRTAIERLGLEAALLRAVAIVGRGGVFGITVDMDAFDPADAPGVACPSAGGPPAGAMLAALRRLARRPDCIAIEIAEYHPGRDVAGQTGRLVCDLLESLLAPESGELKAWERESGARNYDPLPVVLARGEGSLLWDIDGNRYVDMMAAYSAVSFGHAHPRLLAAMNSQARRLAVTSRAFHNDRLPAFLRRLAELTGFDRALPMNTGAEAVETALKAARKWGHQIKGIPDGQAEIIACAGNFHGRTIAAVGLSTEPAYREGFGPFPPGLVQIPYGDAAALAAAITPRTAAFLFEPIQGEGGIVVPPAGYLAACAEICRREHVLLIADEVQTGLGRTGRLLACDHEDVQPDGVCLGKALGGGLYPVSAFLASEALMSVFRPGDHGSTFGGNALAAAVATEALETLIDEGLVERAEQLGHHLLARLHVLDTPAVADVRGRGLLTGIEIATGHGTAREVAEALARRGVLTKDTHGTVIRLAPALTIPQDQLDWALDRVAEVLGDRSGRRARAA
ncbi:MAG: ornithine--oxo-acid transaminase [Rhodocyclales bacterium]|nr:ornithine--oxo-acid transaminase [Rhodocyclales bacterium]